MNNIRTILIKSFIKPFYRQHAGLFLFLFIILFGAVGYANGAGLFAYHFCLIQGILQNPFMLLLIIFTWLLYLKKTTQFIFSTMRKPEFRFLQMLSLLEVSRIYGLLVWIEFMILLPVLIYALLIIIEGIYLQAWMPCLIVSIFFPAVCLLSGWWYLHRLQNPGKSIKPLHRLFLFKVTRKPYWTLFISYITEEKKLLFLGIKLYSCCTLYALVLNPPGSDSDMNMIFLFFSFGILGHGLLIHQMRDFEETRLRFYRVVAFSLFRRFGQYAILYFILLIPEVITIALMIPNHLHVSDAVLFILFSYSLLLFLNSLLFIQFYRMNEYLKMVFCLFLLIFFSILTGSTVWLSIVLLIFSVIVFRKRYYQYEGEIQTGITSRKF